MFLLKASTATSGFLFGWGRQTRRNLPKKLRVRPCRLLALRCNILGRPERDLSFGRVICGDPLGRLPKTSLQVLHLLAQLFDRHFHLDRDIRQLE